MFILARSYLPVSESYIPKLKTSWLVCLLRASEHGQLDSAAHSLNLSPYALKRNLRQLAEALGQDLFIPHRGSLILTQKGQQIVAQAQLLLKDLQDLNQLFDQKQQTYELKLGYLEVWDSAFMESLLEEILGCFQNLKISIRQFASQKALEAALLRQEIDFGFADHSPQAPSLHLWQAQPIPCVIVSKPQLHRHWSEFKYAVPAQAGSLAPTSWDEQSYPRQAVFICDSLQLCLDLCRQNQAAACLPLHLVKEALEKQELAIVAQPPVPSYFHPSVFWQGELSDFGQMLLRLLSTRCLERC